MSEPVIAVSGLTVRRSHTTILDGVDWVVRSGQHWVILGPNGSGKTSLLSTLTGYLTPTSGTLSVCGETFGAYPWPELRKRIGLVSTSIKRRVESSESALEVVVSGRYAMLNYWGEITAPDRADATTVLRQLGLEALADRAWLYLSQGERQRVFIGRALMAAPELLILDEPCAGLDPVARERFLGFLDTLAAAPNGPVLVLVTHHVEEILPAFSHILMLREGRVTAQGETAETLTPENLETTFGAPLRLERRRNRYQLGILPLE